MPNWFYEKKDLRNTPSIASSFCDYEKEIQYRREGARFIQELGRALGLGHDTMATGSVYFHRFYLFHSFSDFPPYVTAACALFLAGKVEETPKKVRDFNKTVRSLTNDDQFATFGKDPREEILTLERVLLQTIKFDLQVDHPYSSLIKFAKCLNGDSAKLQKIVQMSWTFINDSLCTTLCLQWEPEIIAIAVMHLAGKLSKFDFKDWNNRTSDHRHWWDQYVQFLQVDVLEDICHQVLDLYSRPTTTSSANLVSSKTPQTIPAPVRSQKSLSSPQLLSSSNPSVKTSQTKMFHHSPALPISVSTGSTPRQLGTPSGFFAPPTKALSAPLGFSYRTTPSPKDYRVPLPCSLPPLRNNSNPAQSQTVHTTEMSPPLDKIPMRRPARTPEAMRSFAITSTPISRRIPTLEFGRGSHSSGFGRGSLRDGFVRGGHRRDFGRGGYDWENHKEGDQRQISRTRPYHRPQFEGHRGRF